MITNTDMEVWNPKNYIHGAYLEKVEFRETNDGLVIVVENENCILHFNYDKYEFGNFVLAFRFTDEMKSSSLLELASKARTNYFGKDDESWYLYKMTNSKFLDWYDNQPGPGRDLFDIQHHVISTSETTFEILCKYDPRINIVEKNI